MAVTELILTGGEHLRIAGDPREVEKTLLSASRGSLMELAWVTDADSGDLLGINPEHVVMLRGPAPDSAPA